MKILLFDIDGTILDTGGAGGQSISEAMAAYAKVTLEEVPPLDLAGTTDTLVWKDLLSHFGLSNTEEARTQLSEMYLSRLAENLGKGDFRPKLCPGVADLIPMLALRQDCLLGLLTGNMEKGAYVKLEPFDLGAYFSFGAFGDEHEKRAELATMAAARGAELIEEGSGVTQTVVIGDTPRDIACAKAAGLLSLAVATGNFSSSELKSHSPTYLLENLSDSAEVLEALDF